MKRAKIRPCDACGHMTRPARAKLADHPGTYLRYGERCETCHKRGVPAPPRMSEAEIIAGLEAFLTASRAREAAMSRREFVAYHHLNQQETA